MKPGRPRQPPGFKWDLFRQHIIEYANAQQVSVQQLSRECGLSKNAIYKFLLDPNKVMTVDSLAKVITACDLDFSEYTVKEHAHA